MKKESNTTTYSKNIIDIADYIFKNPQYKTAEIISVFCGKLRKGKRSIESYIKQAKEYNKTRLQKQEKEKDKILTEHARKTAKSAILTRKESLEILSNKANGKAREIPIKSQLVNGKKTYTEWTIEYPSDSDQIKAIQQLAKMEGWESSRKLDIDISQPIIIRKNYD